MSAYVADRMGAPLVFIAVLVVLGAYVGIGYARGIGAGAIGLTTEIAALLTYLIGAIAAAGELTIAAPSAVGITTLLALKPWTERLVQSIDAEDLQATLRFAVVAALVLPLLPNEPLGPPRRNHTVDGRAQPRRRLGLSRHRRQRHRHRRRHQHSGEGGDDLVPGQSPAASVDRPGGRRHGDRHPRPDLRHLMPEDPPMDLGPTVGSTCSLSGMILAFFIECSCPPDRRAATVGGGDFASVEDFFDSYQLTHIECQSCNTYYQLIGYIDEDGVEKRVARHDEAETSSPRQRLRSSFRPRHLG